jgi:hypothetical protein
MESFNTTSASAVDIRNSEDFKQCVRNSFVLFFNIAMALEIP